MQRINVKSINAIVLLFASFIGCTSPDSTLPSNLNNSSDIRIVGEMRQVMRDGKLDGVRLYLGK